MSAFILAVIGISAIGVLLDVIVPDGEISKYVKGVFSLFVVIAIISPIFEFLNMNSFDFGTLELPAFSASESFLKSATDVREQEYEEHLSAVIFDEIGLKNDVDVSYSVSRKEFSAVSVIFNNSVIYEKDERIYIMEKAKSVLTERENIDGDIVVCLWR